MGEDVASNFYSSNAPAFDPNVVCVCDFNLESGSDLPVTLVNRMSVYICHWLCSDLRNPSA